MKIYFSVMNTYLMWYSKILYNPLSIYLVVVTYYLIFLMNLPFDVTV